jgi:hypothetical protein
VILVRRGQNSVPLCTSEVSSVTSQLNTAAAVRHHDVAVWARLTPTSSVILSATGRDPFTSTVMTTGTFVPLASVRLLKRGAGLEGRTAPECQ